MYCKPIILGPNGRVPVYKTKQAACADVFLPEDITIEPGKVAFPGLQLGFDIPADCKIIMYPRSSLLIKFGIMQPTSIISADYSDMEVNVPLSSLLIKFGIMQPTSIIDADYSGMEVHVPLYNATDKPVTLKADTRVAQIELQKYTRVLDWDFEPTERTGGCGSTGEN